MSVVKIESVRLGPRRVATVEETSASGAVSALAIAAARGDGPEAPMDGEALLTLLAAGDLPAFATDSRDRIVFWNRGMAELVGQTSHSALGRRCYDVLAGRDVFGNRFCYANCPVVATAREGEPVCAFELKVPTSGPERLAAGFTILKVPGARPDIFTLVHIVQPLARDGWLAELLRGLDGKSLDGPGPTLAQAKTAAVPLPPLTRREGEILRHLAAGLPNKEVAQALDLSLATVRNHVHNILEKLGVHSKLEAVSLSFRNGWVGLNEGPAGLPAVPAVVTHAS